MGTSQSSSGAPSGQPMVPPWTPEAPPFNGQGDGVPDQEPADETPAPPPVPIAPFARFGPSRSSLGQFARTGDTADMQRGLGHYVRRGLGGSSTAARRFGGTARTAGALYGAFSATAAGRAVAPGSPLDPAILSGRSADEITDAVLEAVRPIDGTQDAEASRLAIRNAISELLNRFPGADLLNLSEDQRLFVIERQVALEVYTQFHLDVGKSVQDKAPSATTALARLREIKNYIRETTFASFRRLRAASEQLNANRIVSIVRQALEETFEVFEGYVS